MMNCLFLVKMCNFLVSLLLWTSCTFSLLKITWKAKNLVKGGIEVPLVDPRSLGALWILKYKRFDVWVR